MHFGCAEFVLHAYYRNRGFRRLGLSDAVILEIVSADTPVLTVDLDLYFAATNKNPGAAVNFWHLG